MNFLKMRNFPFRIMKNYKFSKAIKLNYYPN